MKKWIKINGYKINVTKLVAIFPIRDLGEEFGIEVYFVGGELLSHPYAQQRRSYQGSWSPLATGEISYETKRFYIKREHRGGCTLPASRS